MPSQIYVVKTIDNRQVPCHYAGMETNPAALSVVSLANEINAEHALAQQGAATAVQHAIRCGELLLSIKASLKHGEFMPWIEQNCRFPQSTATIYMKAAKQIANGLVISSIRGIFPSGKSESASKTAGASSHTPKEQASVDPESHAMNRTTPKAAKAAAIKELLASGHNVEQISDVLGLSIGNVRALILEYNLATLKHKGRGAAKISPVHVIHETVNAIVATSHGLKLIRGLTIELSKDEAGALLAELRAAMQSLSWLVNILKEKTND